MSIDWKLTLKKILEIHCHVNDGTYYYHIGTVYNLFGIPENESKNGIRDELTRRIPSNHIYHCIKFKDQDTIMSDPYATAWALKRLINTIDASQFDSRWPKSMWLEVLDQLPLFQPSCIIL